MTRSILILGLAALAACAPKRVDEEPILRNGDRVEVTNPASLPGSEAAERDRALLQARRDSLASIALVDCIPSICAAIARGELALGMSEVQVLAATGTTSAAWSARDAAGATLLVPRFAQAGPQDVVGRIAMVQLRDGRVTSYSYRESQGVRVVSAPGDATTAGRANATAEMLIREGDDLAARGDLDGALNRYDRADVLRSGDPMLDYRIASVLDKQLRPVEALIRYQLFLHQLELEKIEATGDAYAKLADAIARARERVIVLERQTR